MAWNSDKHYLADLGEDGIAVVETTYVAPGDDPPPIDGEVVVKPTVSGGGRDTGRFAAADAQLALDLIATIHGTGQDRDGPAVTTPASTPSARPPS